MAREADKEMVRTPLQSDPIDWPCDVCGAIKEEPCVGLRIGYVHQDRAFILTERHKVKRND